MANTKQYMVKVKKDTHELLEAAAKEAGVSITEMADKVFRVKLMALGDSAAQAKLNDISAAMLAEYPGKREPKPETPGEKWFREWHEKNG